MKRLGNFSPFQQVIFIFSLRIRMLLSGPIHKKCWQHCARSRNSLKCFGYSPLLSGCGLLRQAGQAHIFSLKCSRNTMDISIANVVYCGNIISSNPVQHKHINIEDSHIIHFVREQVAKVFHIFSSLQNSRISPLKNYYLIFVNIL